jgi:hypothetical protein
MAELNVIVHRKKSAFPGKRPLPSETPYDRRYGFWGMVTELHPENNTVHVRTPEGPVISNVRVSSDIWVTIGNACRGPGKKFLSGRRKLPPIDTYVLVFMPNGEYSSAVIIASGFSDDPQHGDFKEDSGDAGEKEKGVENSGWTYTEDRRTGTRVLQNRPQNPTIKIEVDQEEEGKEKVNVTIRETKFTVDPENGVNLETDKNLKAAVKGTAEVTADGALAYKCGKTGLLEIGNSIATLGAMVSDLLEACINFKSNGTPETHTAPEFSAKALEIKTKWDKVFKK